MQREELAFERPQELQATAPAEPRPLEGKDRALDQECPADHGENRRADRIAWRLERDGQHRPDNEDPAGECEEGCVPHQRPCESAPFGRALRP